MQCSLKFRKFSEVENYIFFGGTPFDKSYLYWSIFHVFSGGEKCSNGQQKKYIGTPLVDFLPLHIEMLVTTISSHGTAIFSTLLPYIVPELLSLTQKSALLYQTLRLKLMDIFVFTDTKLVTTGGWLLLLHSLASISFSGTGRQH